jgi:hypothetical protein
MLGAKEGDFIVVTKTHDLSFTELRAYAVVTHNLYHCIMNDHGEYRRLYNLDLTRGYIKRLSSWTYGDPTSIEAYSIPNWGSDKARATTKIASTGGSTAYYRLPDHANDLGDLINHKGMSFARGNIFKALWRLGAKEGVDVEYDLNKIKFFAEMLLDMHNRGEHL